ncbi:Cupin-like domain-containing protein [Sphingomonas gellani]|uniref:Cupin-like domain-containing protein n=1 Tax=Sphingomonas gellani TaxID=1166340 RepID=A0A1H8AMJ8_9SPHN|nr:cupin-like domain-containing protein [Sphingomonas gellani]SEM70979.1 Cupin-like domain-containing protein [Sphingomonas gellani]
MGRPDPTTAPLRVTRRTRERDGRGTPPDLAATIADGVPTIFRGAARDWPLVQAGLESPGAAAAYLRRFDAGRPIVGYTAPPDARGRFHYDETVTRMNFRGERLPLTEMLDRIAAHADDPDAPALYVGSTDLDTYLPGLSAEVPLNAGDLFARHPPLASIWVGNRTTAAAHYDQSNNAAVCAVGRRRFTLFPPEQVANLYPGPLGPTPGGQAVTMVDFADPDLARYPLFAEAVEAGEVAELEPGDLLVYPALWWHQVEALEPFNVLINFWWNAAREELDTPMTTLLHAMLSLRDRPEHEKTAWRAIFEYYVFGPADRAAAHLPAAAQGPLAPIDPVSARRLRALVANRLNR